MPNVDTAELQLQRRLSASSAAGRFRGTGIYDSDVHKFVRRDA